MKLRKLRSQLSSEFVSTRDIAEIQERMGVVTKKIAQEDTD